jgi:hypothetical protein
MVENSMLTSLSSAKVQDHPFAHAVVDDVLPTELFGRLRARYPECPPGSGPTGRTIHRGDPAFDAIMAADPDWRALFASCNSAEFVGALTSLFATEIARSCLVPRQDMVFADHIETRAEKETARLSRPALPPEALSVRFDFMQGQDSYYRAPHLDHRRRLATMLVYFDAPGADTYAGGDLILHATDGAEVARISPATNRAVLFACSENSWHAVDPVRDCRQPRRFLQVSVTSCHDIWPGQITRDTDRATGLLQRLRGKVQRFAESGQLRFGR